MKKIINFFFVFCSIHAIAFSSPFSIIYHGSEKQFDQVKPHPNTRFTNGKAVWEGRAIFGTDDYRVALFYTHNSPRGFSASIDLINYCNKEDPITYFIDGGNSEEEALEALWGSFENSADNMGWIYILDGRKFFKEPGLGQMEVITRLMKGINFQLMKELHIEENKDALTHIINRLLCGFLFQA